MWGVCGDGSVAYAGEEVPEEGNNTAGSEGRLQRTATVVGVDQRDVGNTITLP